MKAILASSLGGQIKVDGKRIPTKLMENNGLLDTIRSCWKADSKVMIISGSPSFYDKNDSVESCMKESFSLSGLSFTEFLMCDERNKEIIARIPEMDVESEEAFCKKLTEIKDGIKENGIVCLVINSNVREMDRDTSEEMEPQFEVNLPTEEIQSYLDEVFSNWHVIKKNVAAQEYDIPREMGTSRLSTDVITYLGQMKK